MTCRPDEWVFIAEDRETLQQLHPNSEDILLSGSTDKYAKRPKILEVWCLTDFVAINDIKYVKKNMRDAQKDMVTASRENNIETIDSILQGEENDVQDDVDIYEYDCNRFQQKTLLELHGNDNVILKGKKE